MTREEAIDRMKRLDLNSVDREALYTIIPELRESDDERIRKMLLELAKKHLVNHERCMAESWLEKQKRDGKKWIYEDDYDKDIERSFNEGKDEVLENPEKYGLQKEQKPIEDVVKDITKNKESAIKFLKSAGIMDDNGELAEMYRLEPKLVTFNEPYNPDEYEVVMEGNATSLKRKELKPVDYEHEMWKNCEANFEGGKKEVIEHPEKYGLQKLAEWSEEDKTRLTNILIMLQEYVIHHYSKDDVNKSVDWLKALPERFNLQPKQEWSEEDEKMFASISNLLWEGYGCFKENKIPTPEWSKIRNWLKSLRPQPKAEWNEEDEFFRQQLIVYCEKCVQDTLATKCVDWLKSLR